MKILTMSEWRKLKPRGGQLAKLGEDVWDAFYDEEPRQATFYVLKTLAKIERQCAKIREALS